MLSILIKVHTYIPDQCTVKGMKFEGHFQYHKRTSKPKKKSNLVDNIHLLYRGFK